MKEGWVKKKLGEIIEVAPSKKVQQNLILTDGTTVSFLPMEDLSIDVKKVTPIKVKQYNEVKGSYTFFREGDILLAKVTPCFENGKLGIATNLENNVGFGSSELIVLHNSKETVSSEYVYYYVQLETFRKEGRKVMTGACGLKRLPKTYVAAYSIYFPESLVEQRRIVEKLDAGFAKIEQIKANAEKNLQQAKDLFQATLKKELSGNKDSWVIRSIAEIAEVKGGKRIPKGEKLTTTPTDHPYIRVADFENYGTVNVESVQFISDEIYNQIKRYTISDKDLYLSIAGTIGKTGIIPHELNGANLTENACKLVFQEGIYNRFIYYTSLSPQFKEQVTKLTKTTTQPKLAISRVEQINICLPTSLTEQQKIVDKLDKFSDICKKLEDNYNRILTECDALKQALLRKAFNGEL